MPASLRDTSAVADDLADAWGPCLDAATKALFAENRALETCSTDEALLHHTRCHFALVATALAKAQLVGSLRLVLNENDEGPDAPLAKPLNPNADRVFGFWETSFSVEKSSPFAVTRGRPLDGRAALAARCLARVAAWTFRTEHSQEDVPRIRRAVNEACAAVAHALDAGVGADVRATTAEASSFAAEARALGLVLAAHAADADAAASAVVLAAGLARRPDFFCVAAAAEMSVATLDASRRKSVFASATTTPLLLLTAVRTLLETPEETLEEHGPSPFVALFASLVCRADAETATSAKRALFSDASLFFKSDDVVAALAAASVDECVSTRDTATRACVSTQSTPNADREKVALEALAAFFSDARASRRRARSEAVAFKELRRRFSSRNSREDDDDDDDDDARRRLPTFLRLFGAACASATLRRLRLCASARRVSASRRKDVVAAAEGLKFWVAATEALGRRDFPDDDDEKNVVARQTATIAAFLPLALEAIAPSSFEEEEEEEREESFRAKTKEEDDAEKASELRALASAAKTMVTSAAGAAPSAFRAAVAALRPESTARLRAAMARDTVRDVSREHPNEKGHSARASVEDRTSTPLPPPPPSFAAFAAPNDH